MKKWLIRGTLLIVTAIILGTGLSACGGGGGGGSSTPVTTSGTGTLSGSGQ